MSPQPLAAFSDVPGKPRARDRRLPLARQRACILPGTAAPRPANHADGAETMDRIFGVDGGSQSRGGALAAWRDVRRYVDVNHGPLPEGLFRRYRKQPGSRSPRLRMSPE